MAERIYQRLERAERKTAEDEASVAELCRRVEAIASSSWCPHERLRLESELGPIKRELAGLQRRLADQREDLLRLRAQADAMDRIQARMIWALHSPPLLVFVIRALLAFFL